MPFSHLTRWLRDGRSASRGARTTLRVEAMEDRRTPAASLISTNFALTDAANDDSQLVAVASRGRYAIFTSTATDIVAGQNDSASTTDLFWVDTLTGQRKLVTAAAGSNGTIATGQVGQAVISADGLSVAFVSNVNAATYDTAFNAATDAGSITNDVFQWNSTTGLATLVSRNGTSAVGLSDIADTPSINGDGTFVSFVSTIAANNYDPAVTDLASTRDVFTTSIAGLTTRCTSVFNNVVTATRETFGKYGDVQVDSAGRYMDNIARFFVIKASVNPALINATFAAYPSQLKNVSDVWQLDNTGFGAGNVPLAQIVSTVAGSNIRSLGAAGGRVDVAILAPDNPEVVVYSAISKSGATNELVAGYQNNNAASSDLYFRLMNTAGSQPNLLVSAAAGSTSIGANSKLDPTAGSFVVSSDGSRVAFTSAATNLTPTVTDTNADYDVFTWSFTNRVVSAASVTPAGTVAGNAASSRPSLNEDGKFVAFESAATNLTATIDTNTSADVFVRNLTTGTTAIASGVTNGSKAGNGRSTSPKLIGSGASTAVAFNSFSTDLDPLFPSTTFGKQFVYTVGVPIQTSLASRVAVVSGTRNASASFATFANDGSIAVGDKFTPFPGFAGEVRVATGDFDGDGIVDLVAGAGPGGGPRVVVISGASGKVIRDFFAYEPTFRGGVYVAAGDFNGDGKADLAVGADEGGAPRVRVFSAGNVGTPIADFYVYESTFRGGVRVAAGDVNGDGRADLICGAGYGGGPRVTVINGKTLGTTNARLADFFAFENSLRNGVNVSAGDVDGDGRADLGIGAGPGGGPRVTVFSGANVLTGNPAPTQLLNFFAFDQTQRFGVRVAIKNIDGDSVADIMTAPGNGGQNRIRTYSGGKVSAPGSPALIEDFLLYGDASSRLGAWVG